MTPASTSPSILRRTARGAYDLLAFAALASAPAGAVYTYLQFQVSLTPNREQIDTARHAGDLLTLGERALEAKQDELELQRGILAALNKILPEQERARIGIERLAHLNERRLAEVLDARAERQRKAARDARLATSVSEGAAPTGEPAGRNPKRTEPAAGPAQRAPEVGGWSHTSPQATDANAKAKAIFGGFVSP